MAEEMAAELRHLLPKKEGGQPYTFMIVDDSEFMINNLKRIIAGFEAEVMETALDGAIAVQKYEGMTTKPDVITMDLTMPNMGGLDAIKLIMKQNPQQKIVVVSALGHAEAVKEAILNGAKHFIVKPFKREDVYRVFKAILGLK